MSAMNQLWWENEGFHTNLFRIIIIRLDITRIYTAEFCAYVILKNILCNSEYNTFV